MAKKTGLGKGLNALFSEELKNEIEKKVSLSSIGGVEYLSEVIDSVITAANVEYYIDIIREKALRRKLIEVSTNITTSAFDEDSDTYGMILRAKGIVEGQGGTWIHFDYVPGEPDIRCGSAGIIGRLCVIGAGVNQDEIHRLFEI